MSGVTNTGWGIEKVYGGYTTSGYDDYIEFDAPVCEQVAQYTHKGIASTCASGTMMDYTFTFNTRNLIYLKLSYELRNTAVVTNPEDDIEDTGTVEKWTTCSGAFSPTWCHTSITIAVKSGKKYFFKIEKHPTGSARTEGYVAIRGQRLNAGGLQWTYDATRPDTKGARFTYGCFLNC
jgi:hypothetical protein